MLDRGDGAAGVLATNDEQRSVKLLNRSVARTCLHHWRSRCPLVLQRVINLGGIGNAPAAGAAASDQHVTSREQEGRVSTPSARHGSALTVTSVRIEDFNGIAWLGCHITTDDENSTIGQEHRCRAGARLAKVAGRNPTTCLNGWQRCPEK